jgi:Flp pilus assembly protein TadG
VGARRQESPKRCSGDHGMAVVEMALVGIILVFLLFGILVFGYLMSFRQNMVQASAEGARAGAVAASGNCGSMLCSTRDATNAAQQSIGGFHSCDSGLTCSVVQGTCPNAPTVTCITVTLSYDYANHPLLPDVPIISAFLPSTITTTAVAEVNFP